MVKQKSDNEESNFEIGSQFSEDFFGRKNCKVKRTTDLSQFEWNYLMRARLELKQRKKFLQARQTIIHACDQIIINLDDSLVFRPLFEEIQTTLYALSELAVPSLQIMVETNIMQTLQNLRDFCFVTLEFIKNDEARQIVRLVSELFSKWKSKQHLQMFESKPENKISIRNKLTHLYLNTADKPPQPMHTESILRSNQANLPGPLTS